MGPFSMKVYFEKLIEKKKVKVKIIRRLLVGSIQASNQKKESQNQSELRRWIKIS